MEEKDNLDWAYEQLCQTETHSFLTGPAGSGKTTLLQKFMAEHVGEFVALAPTGIAAVKLGGQTIHSFFGFPARPVDFASIKKLSPDYDYARIQLWKRIKYLIFDEASMIRADIMDQISNFCVKNFPGQSFAGKKLILVGDIDQLPPVVSTDEEKLMIKSRYKSEFFFHANCWSDLELFPDPYAMPFELIQLTKVFRQNDPVFINLLNDIKNNRLKNSDIERINDYCLQTGPIDPKAGIILCTTNAIADELNRAKIQYMDSEQVVLDAVVSGEFEKKDFPVDQTLILKKGCRVMTMRNSGDTSNPYYNGTIGTFIEMIETEVQTEEGETVVHKVAKIVLDDETEIVVPVHEFENVKFVYDEATDKIKHKVVGTFVQYPLKVAYAITIHKSQGQTFDKVVIDLGRGAFAHGQVYVALSRCRSLEGITLRKKLSVRDFIYHPTVVEFNNYARTL